jgi:LDH2 family malate/lactate/ureidoglycolate dehydrogenase
MPGEVERSTRGRRTLEGIAVDDKTWMDILDAAKSVGIAATRAEAIVA